MRGAIPIIVDVDRVSQNIAPDAIRSAITTRTKAIIVVHLAGWPCDMDAIMDIANEFNLKVIEDCAQAHGATYKGQKVGSIGHAAAFSFCQDKIISTGGEGGMMVTHDKGAWEKAWAYKDIGRSYDSMYRREHQSGFRWVTDSFGTNWRLTEMQAAIGRLQLQKLDGWIMKRREYAGILTQFFKTIPSIRVTLPPSDIGHAYYKYYAFVEPSCLKPGWSRDRIIEELTVHGVPGLSGSCSEIYLEKAFNLLPTKPKARLPIAKELGETSLMFLVHPTLTVQEISRTCEIINAVMQNASVTK